MSVFSPVPQRNHTLLLVALSFLAGCLCAFHFENGRWLWWLIALCMPLGFGLHFAGIRLRPAVLLCCFAMAILYTQTAVQTPHPDVGRYEITGYVSGGTTQREDSRMTFAMSGLSLDGKPVQGKAYCSVHCGENPPELFDGALLHFPGYIYLPDSKSGEPHFDFRLWMRQQGYSFGITCYDEIEVANTPETAPVTDGLFRVREAFACSLKRCMGDTGRFAMALLLGETDGLTEDERESFQTLGIAHVMAVSGLHVGILGALVLVLLERLPFGRWTRFFILAVFLAAYCALTGFSAAAIRAAVMLLYYQCARNLILMTDRLTVWAGAIIVVLLINPLYAHSAGFVLSFSAVLSIILFDHRLHEVLDRLFPEPEWQSWRKAGSLYIRFLRLFKNTLRLTLGAQLGVLLPTAYYFHHLPLYGILINLLIVPLVSIILVPLYALTLTASWIPWLGKALGCVASAATNVLLWLVNLLSELPYASARVASPPAITAIGIGFAICMLSRRFPGSFRRRLLASFMTVIVAVGFAWMHRPPELRYIQLDVGQADAALLLDGKTTILIDVGTDGRETLDYLLAEGRDVDALFISHLHMDHIGGAARLLDENIPIRQVYLPANAEFQQADPEALLLLDRMRKAGIPFTELASGDELRYNKTAVQVLWPFHSHGRSGHDANEMPLVLSIRFGDYTILTTGDLEGAYEQYAAVPADVLKAAHHGSSSSTSDTFLAHVQPHYTLISCTSGSSALPGADTLKRLEASGTQILRTDESGDIILSIDQEGMLTVTPYKAR